MWVQPVTAGLPASASALPLHPPRPSPARLPPPCACLQGERRIRGTALYARAALINHECLPNVARFDRFDGPAPPGAPPGANTAAEFRALHDLPAGACGMRGLLACLF